MNLWGVPNLMHWQEDGDGLLGPERYVLPEEEGNDMPRLVVERAGSVWHIRVGDGPAAPPLVGRFPTAGAAVARLQELTLAEWETYLTQHPPPQAPVPFDGDGPTVRLLAAAAAGLDVVRASIEHAMRTASSSTATEPVRGARSPRRPKRATVGGEHVRARLTRLLDVLERYPGAIRAATWAGLTPFGESSSGPEWVGTLPDDMRHGWTSGLSIDDLRDLLRTRLRELD